MAVNISILPFNVPNKTTDATFGISVSKNFKELERILPNIQTLITTCDSKSMNMRRKLRMGVRV